MLLFLRNCTWLVEEGCPADLKKGSTEKTREIVLLLHISGNETRDVAQVNLITVTPKPEETCK